MPKFEWDEHKNDENQVDFTDHKVEALEAMQLAKAGVDVPE